MHTVLVGFWLKMFLDGGGIVCNIGCSVGGIGSMLQKDPEGWCGLLWVDGEALSFWLASRCVCVSV